MTSLAKNINVSTIKTIINFGVQFEEPNVTYKLVFTPSSIEYFDEIASVVYAVSSEGSTVDGNYIIDVAFDSSDTEADLFDKANAVLNTLFEQESA